MSEGEKERAKEGVEKEEGEGRLKAWVREEETTGKKRVLREK